MKGADGKPISDADVSVAVRHAGDAGDEDGGDAERGEAETVRARACTSAPGNVMMAGKWNATVSVKKGGKDVGQKKLTLTAK